MTGKIHNHLTRLSFWLLTAILLLWMASFPALDNHIFIMTAGVTAAVWHLYPELFPVWQPAPEFSCLTG
jgi:hypothetical protein